MSPVATAHVPATRALRARRPQITIALLLGGIIGAAGIGAASAAAPDEEVPSRVVKYDPASLSTDRGARAVYRKIVAAAKAVCPTDAGSPRLPSMAVVACRKQSIARAVLKINDPRLAAIHSRLSGTG